MQTFFILIHYFMYRFELNVLLIDTKFPSSLIKLILVDLKYLFKPQTYSAISLLRTLVFTCGRRVNIDCSSFNYVEGYSLLFCLFLFFYNLINFEVYLIL